MNRLSKKLRLLLAPASVGLVTLVVSGCGTTTADVEDGRLLFIQKCGNCHKLAEAGTSANQGPDLDAAFAAARASGQDSDTIEGVVESQIKHPRPSTEDPAISMPADLVTGQDLADVSAYVAKWAGVPGAAPPRVPGGPGAQVFANTGCASCHTLKALNAGGTTGPNLDEALPGQSFAMVHESIVDPDKVIAKGYAPGIMPDNYDQQLSPKEIDDLTAYLLGDTKGTAASKQKSGKAGGGSLGASGKSG
jgi:mono/diheme cytochrome c family protein